MSPQSFPADLRILQSIATVFGAQDSLQSINTTKVSDRALVLCAENNSIYILRKDSTTAPSGNDIVQPAAGPGRWFIYPSGGGGADFVNLPNTFFVAQGTTVALADQIGNIEAPFETLAQALAAIVALPTAPKCIIVFPGDYSTEDPFVYNSSDAENGGVLTLVNGTQLHQQFGITNGNVTLPALTLTGNANIRGCILTGVTPGFSLELWLASCQMTTGQLSCTTLTTDEDCYLIADIVLLSIGSVLRNTVTGDISVPGDGGTSLEMVDCDPTGDITLSGSGFVEMDDVTARNIALNGHAVVGGRINTTFPILEDNDGQVDDNTLVVDFNEGGSFFRTIEIVGAETNEVTIVPPSYAHRFQLKITAPGARTFSWTNSIAWGAPNGELTSVTNTSDFIVDFYWNTTQLYANYIEHVL